MVIDTNKFQFIKLLIFIENFFKSKQIKKTADISQPFLCFYKISQLRCV